MPHTAYDIHPDNFRSLLLFVYTIAHYALMYFANIVLARALTISEYDDYSVAISVVTMLSTMATLGLEKYALRGIALFRERQDWPRFHGFWLFSLKTITLCSLLLMTITGISLETALRWNQAEYHIAIVIYAFFLPFIALTLFLVEVISALGRHLTGVAVYRLIMPFSFLILVSSLSISNLSLTAATAVQCLGAAWMLAFILMWQLTKAILPDPVFQTHPLILREKWLKRSLPLVFNSLMLTIITSGGVVVLELLFPSGLEVGVYAVAAQTGGFISLIGTSTNRYYLPTMVVLVERRDKAGIQRLINQRAMTIGSLILTLYVSVVFSGHFLLNLFGPHFNGGYFTLVCIAAGASMSGLFADMPYYLQYMGFNKTVVSSTFIATVTMLTLSILLGKAYGTVGVACSYAFSVFVLFFSFRIMVTTFFKKF